MSETTRFRQYDDVAVVEHVDSTRQPREGGEVQPATVTAVEGAYVKARTEFGNEFVFYAESGWRAWDGTFQWRLVPVCRCEKPILGTSVVAADDPLGRQFCSEECADASAEAAYEQQYRPRVAT